MPKHRLEYLDFLKGVAIFLMVMGHFLSWTFAPNVKPTAGAMFVRNLIYAFHMPLFFFISGYLMHLKRDSNYVFSFCNSVIKKRLQTLMLPGATFMVLTYFRTDVVYFEWFLRTLFELYLVFCLTKFITNLFNDNITLELVLHMIIIVSLFFCEKKFDNTLLNTIIDFPNLAHRYPYFLLGFYFLKFDINRFLQKDNSLYTFSILGFISLFLLSNQMGLLPTKYTQYFTATFGIITCLKLAMDINYYKAGFFVQTLLKWGSISIEIYLLSGFLIPYFPDLGNLFIVSDGYIKMGPVHTPEHLTSIFLQIITGLVTSLYVCVVCQALKYVIAKSNFLNFVLFGKKTNP